MEEEGSRWRERRKEFWLEMMRVGKMSRERDEEEKRGVW